MPGRVATRYDIRWSGRITMWKSSFMSGLYSYGLPLEDLVHDDIDTTIIRRENLPMVLEKMRGDLPTHLVSQTVTVNSVANALEAVLLQAEPGSDVVRIKWD